MIHVIRVRPAGQIHPIDSVAMLLAIGSKTAPIADEVCRELRDELADRVGPGLLADLLRGGRPIQVTSSHDELWQVRDCSPEAVETAERGWVHACE